MNNQDILDSELSIGAEKARKIARTVLSRVREEIGY